MGVIPDRDRVVGVVVDHVAEVANPVMVRQEVAVEVAAGRITAGERPQVRAAQIPMVVSIRELAVAPTDSAVFDSLNSISGKNH